MTFELPAVLTSALVAVVLVPLVTYFRDRRVTHSQRAFEARRELYQRLLRSLIDYRDHVYWMPPNQPGDEDARPADSLVLDEDVQFDMHLHASPVLQAYIRELLVALDESKGQSWHRQEMQRHLEAATDKEEQERFAERMFKHDDKKLVNDKWAEECLARVRHRIRWELYGWRRSSPLLRWRVRPVAKRISEHRTDFFTGGVPWG